MRGLSLEAALAVASCFSTFCHVATYFKRKLGPARPAQASPARAAPWPCEAYEPHPTGTHRSRDTSPAPRHFGHSQPLVAARWRWCSAPFPVCIVRIRSRSPLDSNPLLAPGGPAPGVAGPKLDAVHGVAAARLRHLLELQRPRSHRLTASLFKAILRGEGSSGVSPCKAD